MKIVLDTSVLIAATRSRRGASHRLLTMLPSPGFDVALSVPLYMEWMAVMSRPEHLPSGMTAADAEAFLRYLASICIPQEIHFLWRPFLRDPNDDMVLECAVASGSRYLLTHNVKDFSGTRTLGVHAMTPADFLRLMD